MRPVSDAYPFRSPLRALSDTMLTESRVIATSASTSRSVMPSAGNPSVPSATRKAPSKVGRSQVPPTDTSVVIVPRTSEKRVGAIA